MAGQKGVHGSLPIDLTGQRFGKLVAIKIHKKAKSGNMIWECFCDCGTTIYSWQGSLHKGKAKACLPCSKIKPEAAFNRIWDSYTKWSKRKGRSFTLTVDEFRALIIQNCYYCNAEPSNFSTTKRGVMFVYNGIDRMDNSTGYDLPNCVPCCKDCNFLKSRRSAEEFLTKISKIYLHRIEKCLE